LSRQWLWSRHLGRVSGPGTDACSTASEDPLRCQNRVHHIVTALVRTAKEKTLNCRNVKVGRVGDSHKTASRNSRQNPVSACDNNHHSRTWGAATEDNFVSWRAELSAQSRTGPAKGAQKTIPLNRRAWNSVTSTKHQLHFGFGLSASRISEGLCFWVVRAEGLPKNAQHRGAAGNLTKGTKHRLNMPGGRRIRFFSAKRTRREIGSRTLLRSEIREKTCVRFLSPSGQLVVFRWSPVQYQPGRSGASGGLGQASERSMPNCI